MTEQQASVAAVAAPQVDDDAVALAAILGTGKADQAAPEAQASEPSEPDAPVAEDLKKVLTALEYAGVPKSVLESTPEAVLRTWGTEQQGREAKTKTELQRRSEEAKQAKDELGRFASVKQPETATQPERKARTDDVDLEAELKPIVDELRELGVPAGERLASAMKRMSAASSARLEGLESVNRSLVSEVTEFFVDQARSKLEAQYPQLSDDAVFAKVREESEAQVRTGRYENVPYRKGIAQALETAAKLVLFDDIVKSHSEKVQSQHRERIAGQPTAPSRRPEAVKLSDDDLDTQIAQLLSAGKTEEARRLARG